MGKIEFQRAGLLKRLYDMVKGNISDNVFVSDRPEAVQKGMSDFAIVRLSQGITDRGDTYQTTFIQIGLFARNLSSGQENTAKLEGMLEKTMALFPICDDMINATQPRLLIGGDDGVGFHSVVVQSRAIIKKQITQ